MLSPDPCPQPLGLRAHPKHALRVGIIYGQDDADLVAFYAHDGRSLGLLREALSADSRFHLMEIEEWDSQAQKWGEVA